MSGHGRRDAFGADVPVFQPQLADLNVRACRRAAGKCCYSPPEQDIAKVKEINPMILSPTVAGAGEQGRTIVALALTCVHRRAQRMWIWEML